MHCDGDLVGLNPQRLYLLCRLPVISVKDEWLHAFMPLVYLTRILCACYILLLDVIYLRTKQPASSCSDVELKLGFCNDLGKLL